MSLRILCCNNTGNTTLTNVVVTDPMIGLITGNPIATLAVGASLLSKEHTPSLKRILMLVK
jgi:hypothetical protein